MEGEGAQSSAAAWIFFNPMILHQVKREGTYLAQQSLHKVCLVITMGGENCGSIYRDGE